MARLLAFELGISALYFFVGLLIGYIAESRGWLYAIFPPLLIRTVQGAPFFVFVMPGTNGPISPLISVMVVMAAVIVSFLGGLAGASLRSRATAGS
jgi:hypothetical protein